MLQRFILKIKAAFSPEKALYFELKRILGVYPKNITYYKTAFIHRSASRQLPTGHTVNNERLEYLGDAILNAIVADYLFEHFPCYKEGQLTQMRSKIVNYTTLTQIAHNLGIDKYIVSQVSVQYSGKYFYGDTVEAIIGALFLDKGFNCTKTIVLQRFLKDYLDAEALVNHEVDFKSRVIEWCQKYKYNIAFNCKVKNSSSKSVNLFCVDVLINGKIAGNGTGTSKKEAEQNAARTAWAQNVDIENQQA